MQKITCLLILLALIAIASIAAAQDMAKAVQADTVANMEDACEAWVEWALVWGLALVEA